jgi:glycosyltransferase involved in cell wall biosynthesis
LFINRIYPPYEGATGRLLADLAGALAAAGWRVTVLAAGSADLETVDGPVGVVRAAAPKGRSPRAALRQLHALGRAALRLPPADLTVTLTDPPLLALLGPQLKRRGSALLHWCHDLYPDLLAPLGLGLPGAVRAALAGLVDRAVAAHDGIVAIGRAMAHRLSARGASVRPAVIANWADPVIRPDPAAAAAFRRAQGFDGRTVAMYSGNFGRLYDFRPVLDAAAVLGRTRPEVLVALAGGGARFAETEAEAARRGLANVRMLPAQPRERLSGSLGAADLHLATMPDGALGMMEPCKVYGILAAGRPCLFAGPATSDTARLVAESGAGRVVAGGDAGALADAIATLALRPDLMAAMSARALAAAAPCRLELAAARFDAVARGLLSAARRPQAVPAAGFATAAPLPAAEPPGG